MAVATKKRPPMEMEPGEGKAHESAESAAEETREGAEPDDAPKGKTNRKRSAKNAKATKAPMDSDCGCGAPKGQDCACDSGCGNSYAKKRSDALTPQEYLAACELGIQGRSRAYIRSRLDAAERLDLKCGNGSISEGEKCTKGTAQKAEKPVGYANPSGAPLTNHQVRQIERNIVAHEKTSGKNMKLSPEQTALLIQTPGTQSRRAIATALRGAGNKELKSAIKASENTADPVRQAIRKVAKREVFNRRVQRGVNLLGAGLALGAIAASTAQTRRRDSVYAAGFSPELDQLAI
jgi:hypothetical protein